MKIYQTGANSYANGVAEVNLATGAYRGDKADAYALAKNLAGVIPAIKLLPRMRQEKGTVSARAAVGGSFSFRPCI